VESGRHDALVDSKGLYFAMWRQQIGEARDPERGSLTGEKELVMKN
jgi:hypothetical protein